MPKELRLAEFQSHDLTVAVANILDVFTGSDGGGDFVDFCTMLRSLDDQARDGNEVAKQITDVVRQFGRLVKLKK